jgi:hypothetical protein
MDSIKALLVLPDEKPRLIEIENTNEGIQKIIGGYYQALTVTGLEECMLLCDEDGKLKHRDPNFIFWCDLIVGPVLFVGLNDHKDGFGDVPGTYVDTLTELVKVWRISMNLRRERETL